MHRAPALEEEPQPVPGREAGSAPPRPTPLTLVAGAVAGGDLQEVAATAAEALGCPVAIAIPGRGRPVVAPSGSLGEEAVAAIAAHAAAVVAGEDPPLEPSVAGAVAVRIGDLTVGVVAAVPGSAEAESPAERRAWLDAAAAAASVTAVMRDSQDGDDAASDAILLAELAAGPPADLPAFLVRARRLGLDLTTGGVALSARGAAAAGELENLVGRVVRSAGTGTGALIAERRPGALLALAPLANAEAADPAAQLAGQLRAAGLSVVVSAPRRDPALLHDALREAELLAELGGGAEDAPAGHDGTYRLLIAVLLHDRSELEQLHHSTVTPLAAYDARHDTDLIATLRAFLAHDGSTTDAAEAMKLHRHTVGYRLARVHEVSGLSPYESDGRERLSLGLKAYQILEAARRLEEATPLRQ
ncbi:MAG TPA: helix-turn-helix domain-containing protein [Solirubrobacteraceae bacterium]|nr:helix-turn-helix domain-containing protein [Solirubrobacteraceae bacterium]